MGYGANYTAITAGKKPLKSENSMIFTSERFQIAAGAGDAVSKRINYC